jgi:hypothetical protein
MTGMRSCTAAVTAFGVVVRIAQLLAFIILAALDAPFDHDGIRPQRTSERLRCGSLGCCRMMGTG